jgi:hypothetical protein
VVRKDGGLFTDEESVQVNYRLPGNRYIVDSIFDRAILVARQLQPGSRHHSKREIKMRILLITLLCACLGACAFQPLTRDNPFAALDEKIATDTVNQLARLYPPGTFGAVFSPKPADGSNMPRNHSRLNQVSSCATYLTIQAKTFPVSQW